ncbi:histidine transporter, partial [Staphylococcus pseudintermedius]
MKHQTVKGNQMWRFWVLSSIGVICFFVPFQINGVQTIIVDHVHLAIRAGLKSVMPYIALTMILIGAILPIY